MNSYQQTLKRVINKLSEQLVINFYDDYDPSFFMFEEDSRVDVSSVGDVDIWIQQNYIGRVFGSNEEIQKLFIKAYCLSITQPLELKTKPNMWWIPSIKDTYNALFFNFSDKGRCFAYTERNISRKDTNKYVKGKIEYQKLEQKLQYIMILDNLVQNSPLSKDL